MVAVGTSTVKNLKNTTAFVTVAKHKRIKLVKQDSMDFVYYANGMNFAYDDANYFVRSRMGKTSI